MDGAIFVKWIAYLIMFAVGGWNMASAIRSFKEEHYWFFGFNLMIFCYCILVVANIMKVE